MESSGNQSPLREKRSKSRSQSPRNYRHRSPHKIHSDHYQNKKEASYSRSPRYMYFREKHNSSPSCLQNSMDRQSISPRRSQISPKKHNYRESSSRYRSRERERHSSEKYSKKPIRENLRCSLIVRNLSYKTSGQSLKAKFSKYGEIRDIYIPRNYYTKRAMGYGFIEFFDERGAKTALREMDGKNLEGSYVKVCYAREGRKTPGEMRWKDKPRRSRSRSPKRRHHSRSVSREKSPLRETSPLGPYRSPKKKNGSRRHPSSSTSRSREGYKKHYKRSPKEKRSASSQRRSSSLSYSPQ